MDAEVVVFVAVADVAGVFDASIAQNGNEWPREDFDFLPILLQFIRFQRKLCGDVIHEFIECACVAAADDFIDDGWQ